MTHARTAPSLWSARLGAAAAVASLAALALASASCTNTDATSPGDAGSEAIPSADVCGDCTFDGANWHCPDGDAEAIFPGCGGGSASGVPCGLSVPTCFGCNGSDDLVGYATCFEGVMPPTYTFPRPTPPRWH